MQKILLTSIALILMNTDSLSAQTVTVVLKNGMISGQVEKGVNVYRGIPYAAPPVGDLRWKAPQPVRPWRGVKKCHAYANVCPQAPYPPTSLYRIPEEAQDEDCLNLNVWSTAKTLGERRPVMVWIHGGAMTRGGGTLPHYDGSNLAKKGVVVVTINYRLGPLGFLAHPDLSAESPHKVSGNYALLDQIAALKWVQHNISMFGGDPQNVTIFGESAGSLSVCLLVASPLAKGLFHKAIGQSGAAFGKGIYLKESRYGLPSGEEMGRAFMRACGVNSLKELRQLPAQKIIEVFNEHPDGKKFKSRILVDGWVFPEEPKFILQKGKQNKVPVLIGSNADEWTAFTNPQALPKTVEAFRNRIAKQYPGHSETYFEAYPASSETDILRSHLDHGGDFLFNLPMRRWARATAAIGQAVYLYHFTRIPQIKNKAYYGAYHAAEIPYVFDNLAEMRFSKIFEEEDYELSAALSNYWVNFAKNGHPNTEELMEWKAYDIQEEHYLEAGDSIQVKRHLLKKRLDVLEELLGRD